MRTDVISARPLLFLQTTADFEFEALHSAVRVRGWDVHLATDASEALKAMAERDFMVGLVLVDGSDQGRLTQQIQHLISAGHSINWVALLANRSLLPQSLSRILATYFYDYHTLPLDAERLNATLGHAYGMAEIAIKEDPRYGDSHLEHRMIGKSFGMQTLFRKIHKIARLDLTVLIRGESGTGKELTAAAIHRTSSRAANPFIAVNCGALPRDLIHSELFGHERGSFTGAKKRHVGRIEAAAGGTLLLDEIGDLPYDLQVNLLRFLQEKTIARIGGHETLEIDVRIIAATNVDLELAVREGRFREDLYYRLNVLHLKIPPLRERLEDIEILAEYFFEETAKHIPFGPKGFSQSAIDAMNTYAWPGNVRELINRIQRAVAMCEGKVIKAVDLGLDGKEADSGLMSLSKARSIAERAVIIKTLGETRNNVSMAARSLGISRVTLYRLMETHGIDWQTPS